MADQDSVWYRLGYALEQAREHLTRADRLRTLEERQADRKVGATRTSRPGRGLLRRSSPTGEPWEAVVAVGATALLGRVLEAMPGTRKPGAVRLLRAGAAGVGAALLRELIRSLRTGDRPPPPLAQLVQDAVASPASPAGSCTDPWWNRAYLGRPWSAAPPTDRWSTQRRPGAASPPWLGPAPPTGRYRS